MTDHGQGSITHGFWRRAYRGLLPLLPHGLRSRQGESMLELFDRELRRREADGSLSVWSAGVRGLADLACRGVYERLSEERRALTTANLVIIRNTAFAFIGTSAALTALFVAKFAMTHAATPLSGTVFDVVLFSIPFTAAFTIPMSVFIAVLWASSRRPKANLSRERSDNLTADGGTPRLGPIIAMAFAVALCCLALNAELVPRANLRLQRIYSVGASFTPNDRSMTLRELRQAESRLVTATQGVSASKAAGATLASYEVEIQKKLALAAACVVLAVLAAGIARRASRTSVWAQSVISLVVFTGYYVCIIVGEQLADRSAIPPALAMWSANIIVLLIALLVARRSRVPATA
jgi:Lipopolysaccharide export system permease LptF/LptG